jgi:hypothetical protein
MSKLTQILHFVYSWDVNTGSHQLLVSFIPALSNIESSYIEGIPKLSINTNLGIPHEALLLKRYFNVETEWDHPEKNIVGPKEVDIQFDQLLGDDTKPKLCLQACKGVIRQDYTFSSLF